MAFYFPRLAAASLWRQVSAQLGMVVSFSERAFRAAGMSMFWGQLRAHLPQAMQAVGFFSSGRNSTRMAAFTVEDTRSSL